MDSENALDTFQIGNGYVPYMSYEAVAAVTLTVPDGSLGFHHFCVPQDWPDGFGPEDNLSLCPHAHWSFGSTGRDRTNRVPPGQSVAGFTIQFDAEGGAANIEPRLGPSRQAVHCV